MIPLSDIAQTAADHFNMPVDSIKRKTRKTEYVRVRTLFYKLASSERYTRREIAEYIGMDMSTVTHHVNKKEYVV